MQPNSSMSHNCGVETDTNEIDQNQWELSGQTSLITLVTFVWKKKLRWTPDRVRRRHTRQGVSRRSSRATAKLRTSPDKLCTRSQLKRTERTNPTPRLNLQEHHNNTTNHQLFIFLKQEMQRKKLSLTDKPKENVFRLVYLSWKPQWLTHHRTEACLHLVEVGRIILLSKYRTLQIVEVPWRHMGQAKSKNVLWRNLFNVSRFVKVFEVG